MDTPSRAPLDPHEVERTLAPFGRSLTLPASAYISPEVFAWERRHFFEDAWVCVGRHQDVPLPGDVRAANPGPSSVVLARDEVGELRAFFNVCRHRGHELLSEGESAHAPAIVCRYHSWTYGLNGSLKGAPGFRDDASFDCGDFPLIPARMEEWHGWLFVNVSADAPYFPDYVGGLEGLVRNYEPERLVAAARRNYLVEANWKLIVENYHECYHCSSLHPELCEVSPPNSGSNLEPDGSWIGGSMDLRDGAQTMSLTGAGCGPPLRGLDPGAHRRVLYLSLWPNLLLSLHPDYVMTHRIEPRGHERSSVECEWLFPQEAIEREGFDPSYASDFWDIVNEQDWRACESVQRGMSSRGHRPGPLSPREDAVYRFMRLVGRSYLEGRAVSHEES
jgi:glycine betaine catabolism A